MIHNPGMEKQELTDHLMKRLIVVTKEHESTQELVIDRVGLSNQPDGVRRSMSIGNSLRKSIGGTEVSQKDIARNRAKQSKFNDTRESLNNSVSIKSSLVNTSLNS